MSYTPPTGLPFFSAHNSQFQNESSTTFDLDFDTFTNISFTSTNTAVIPNKAFFWGDGRSVKDAGDSDSRHFFRFHFTNTALSDQTATQETSGRGGTKSYPTTSDVMYGLNKTGVEQSTNVRCTGIFNDHDQVANFNRLVGVFVG
jgi:hypothetical protein